MNDNHSKKFNSTQSNTKSSPSDVKFGNVDLVQELTIDGEIQDKRVIELVVKSQLFIQKGQFEEAIKCLEEALSVFPDNITILLNIGVSLSQSKRHHDAIRYYDKILTINPNHVITLSNLGMQYSRLGNYDKAISFYDRALSLNPNHAMSTYNKACSLSMRGDTGDALTMLETAINLDPRCKKRAITDEEFINIRDFEPFRLMTS